MSPLSLFPVHKSTCLSASCTVEEWLRNVDCIEKNGYNYLFVGNRFLDPFSVSIQLAIIYLHPIYRLSAYPSVHHSDETTPCGTWPGLIDLHRFGTLTQACDLFSHPQLV